MNNPIKSKYTFYKNSYLKIAVFFLLPILSFSQTHQLTGRTQDSFQNNISYQIAITHLGYKKVTNTIRLTQDRVKNYTLYESTETLKEILIKAEMAVIVKECTITYRTDQFKAGEEHRPTQSQKIAQQPHKLSNNYPIFGIVNILGYT